MAFNSPTAQDVFDKNNDALYTNVGMTHKGDNESGQWARRNQQITGVGFTNANDYAVNQLEPARQNNLNYLIGMTQPGNVQARTQRNASGMINRGMAIGDQQARGATARGYSPEFAQALRASIAAHAQRNANAYIGEEDNRLMDNSANAQKMIQQGQQNPFLEQFMALAQLIEGRSQANKADKAQGGFMNQIAPLLQLAGGMDWGSLFSPKRRATEWGDSL